LHQWQDGERRLAQAPTAQRRALERVVERITTELRWRLGTSFATTELVELYEGSSSWSLGLALQASPAEPLGLGAMGQRRSLPPPPAPSQRLAPTRVRVAHAGLGGSVGRLSTRATAMNRPIQRVFPRASRAET
jgi:hypothetical protein